MPARARLPSGHRRRRHRRDLLLGQPAFLLTDGITLILAVAGGMSAALVLRALAILFGLSLPRAKG